MKTKLLIIDDQEEICYSIERVLKKKKNLQCDSAYSADEALEKFQTSLHEIVIVDYMISGFDGIELLKKIKDINQDTIVIMITGNGNSQIAERAIKAGAYDFFSKPLNYIEFFKAIRNSVEKVELLRKSSSLSKESDSSFFGLNFNSSVMKTVVASIKKVAPFPFPVLLNGESGTGKEIVAEAIHLASDRFDKSFIKINCASIPDSLVESELFGHEKGSFTGASFTKKGKFELADGGTLFLDEIGDMDFHLQAKLLRFLEDGIIERVGSEKPFKVDVRVIAATNVNLEKAVLDKKFRLDLFYRLNVARILLPPLSQRKEDIILLAEIFRDRFCEKFKLPVSEFSEEMKKAVLSHNWPGNIRELKNCIQNFVITGTLQGFTPSGNSSNSAVQIEDMPLEQFLLLQEREYLLFMLEKYGSNRSVLAEKMGVSRKTLYKKLNDHGIEY